MAAAGPIGRVVRSDGRTIVPAARQPVGEFGAGASALVMLHRVAFFDPDGERQRLDENGQRSLLRWASQQGLGQDGTLVGQVAKRRAVAMALLARQGLHVVRLVARPEWRLAVGLGNKANAHEIGLSLHGTYGWPVIPGSSLKGLTAAWAIASGANPADVRRVFGSPRRDVPAPEPDVDADPDRTPGRAPESGQASAEEKKDAGRGTVCFLDAVPAGSPVRVEVDVLTPHVKPYYESTAPGAAGPPVPPAEYHNPVPVHFLTVAGAFAVDLYGSCKDDVGQAARWLIAAGEELGAGGKTAAGYGYLLVSGLDNEDGEP